MRKKFAVVFLTGTMMLLSGCTQSNILKPNVMGETIYTDPDMTWMGNWDLDMEELRNDVREIVLDPEEYPMASNVLFTIYGDEGYMSIDIVVKDDTKNEEIGPYMDQVIKTVNDCAATQNFGYEKSTSDSFGGLFQDLEINMKVYFEKDYPDGDVIMMDVVPADTYIEYSVVG